MYWIGTFREVSQTQADIWDVASVRLLGPILSGREFGIGDVPGSGVATP